MKISIMLIKVIQIKSSIEIVNERKEGNDRYNSNKKGKSIEM